MKFKKVLIGLMATMPFALTSCNNTMTFNQAKKWIASHYKATSEPLRAIAYTEWDFHGTKGPIATTGVDKILNSLAKAPVEGGDGLGGIIPERVEEVKSVGHQIFIGQDKIKEIYQLNESNFAPFSKDAKDDVYRVTNGSFNVTYKVSEKYREDKEKEEDNYITTTRIRTYNSKGYCTDFGCKVDGKWIDSKNTMDFKLLVHFIYESDPFN